MSEVLTLEIGRVPDTLRVDERAILRAMGRAMLAVVRARAPSRSGRFRSELVMEVRRSGEVVVYPEGQRNEIIARIQKRDRGNDIFGRFEESEREAIIGAGRAELNRQIQEGEAGVFYS